MANPIAAAATDSLYSGFFNLVRRDVVLQQTLILKTVVEATQIDCNPYR